MYAEISLLVFTHTYYYVFQPPIIPKVYYEGDTRNFDDYPDTWRIRSVTEEELELFDDF